MRLKGLIYDLDREEFWQYLGVYYRKIWFDFVDFKGI
jgi:hypothetical protein